MDPTHVLFSIAQRSSYGRHQHFFQSTTLATQDHACSHHHYPEAKRLNLEGFLLPFFYDLRQKIIPYGGFFIKKLRPRVKTIIPDSTCRNKRFGLFINALE